MKYYLVASVYETLRNLINVTFYASHIGVEEIAHHAEIETSISSWR
jgi:hypothetical protein